MDLLPQPANRQRLVTFEYRLERADAASVKGFVIQTRERIWGQLRSEFSALRLVSMLGTRLDITKRGGGAAGTVHRRW